MVRALCALMALLGAVSLAKADGPFDDSIYGTPAEARWAPLHANLAHVPVCEDPAVLSTVTGRFDNTETTYWGGAHAIAGFERVREVGFRADGIDYIPRRYCVARALVVDSRLPPPQQPRAHTVVYRVGASTGVIGWSWGVEWCVVGFDREHAYDPACAVLRPVIERRIGVLKNVHWLAEYGLRARY